MRDVPTRGRARSIERSVRLYRRLLLVLPRRFRAEAGEALVNVFRDGLRRTRGPAARATYWGRAVLDLLVTAAAERLDGGRHAARPARARSMTDPAFVHSLARDLRHAVRRLLRRPGRTALAGGTLGLGIAATMVMLVLVGDILLRPLPFPEPERLVRLTEVSDESPGTRYWPSWPNIRDWQAEARVFSGIAAAEAPEERPVVLDDRAVRVPVASLSRDFDEVLGLDAAVGRTFAAEESAPGGPPVALVSWAFWRGELRGRPIEELSLTLGEERHQVVGVIPPDFRFLGYGGVWGAAAVWTPFEPSVEGSPRTSHGYHVVARLAPGVDAERARREMAALSSRLKETHGEPTHADRVAVSPLMDEVVGDVRGSLRLLLMAAWGVLLVACLNLSAALLAQGLGRTRELTIRRALGAGRRTVSLQLVTEGLALAVPGFVLGLTGAWGAVAAIRGLAGSSLPRLETVGLNGTDVAVGAAVATGATLLASALPALTVGRRSMAELRAHGGASGRGEWRLWRGFVAAQLALTMVLVVASGLLLRSFVAAASVDRGYLVDDVLVADVSLPESLYGAPAARLELWDRALSEVRALPGVTAAGLTDVSPEILSARIGTVAADGDAENRPWSAFRLVDPGYFEVLGIPLVRGSALPARPAPETAVLIDRRLADDLWPDQDPLGRRLEWGEPVRGVVGSVRSWQGAPRWGAIYSDYRTQPERALAMHVLVRHRGDASAVAASIRSTLARIDPLVPVDVETLASRVRAELAHARLLLAVAAVFALATLALAGVGVYAVVSFAAARRVREAALRLALGARPHQVSGGVMTQGLRPALLGIVLGTVAALPAAATLRVQLFEVRPWDPIVFAVAALTLVSAALLATWLPARRAGGVEPAVAFREE